MRKFRTTEPEQHKARCPQENIPAVPVEESIIQRLKVLSRDKKLLTEILNSNGNQRVGRIEQLNTLIQSKEQDRRRLEKQIDGIVVGMAEAGEASRKLLTKKLDDALLLKESVETEIQNLKLEKADAALAVVNLTDAVKVIRDFQKGFDSRPLTEQKEILRDVLKRIMIHPTKIVCEIYGQEGEEEIPLEGYNSLPEEISGRPIFLEQYRTRVRPGNRLVEAGGIEPPSASDPR